MTSKRYAVEFTLPIYGGKYIPLSGEKEIGFDTIEQAREQCTGMGPIYLWSSDGKPATYWQQRIIDTQLEQVIEYHNMFDSVVVD